MQYAQLPSPAYRARRSDYLQVRTSGFHGLHVLTTSLAMSSATRALMSLA